MSYAGALQHHFGAKSPLRLVGLEKQEGFWWREKEMERLTGEPWKLSTHRTFKTSDSVHFHWSGTGELRKKKKKQKALWSAHIPALWYIHSCSTHTFSHVLVPQWRTVWVSLWTNTITVVAFNPAEGGFRAHEIHGHYCLSHIRPESHPITDTHKQDWAEDWGNVSVGGRQTVVW